jgi:hypothetical protein
MNFCLSIGYGSLLIFQGEFNTNSNAPLTNGDLVIVLFSMMFGSFALSSSAPVLKTISESCHAAVEFFELMEGNL